MAHTPNGLKRSLSAPDLSHCGLKRSLSSPDLPHSSATMSNLLSLPADALLAVLSFLSPRELFSCRVVCRHLRDLCLHRLLWKRLAVDTAGTLRAALALAPCLGRICQNATDMRSLALLVLNSTCVVTVLELLIVDREDAAFATSIILKLSALGGLRALHLEVACDYSKTFTGVLLQAIYNLNGLEFLDFDNDFGGQVPAPVCVREVRPSLSALEYKSVATDAFLEALLRTHAASLTEVALYSITAGTYMSCLAGIHGLRSLTCIANDEMYLLMYLPSLEAVDLLGYVSLFGQDNAPPGVLQFLREAAHLRRVEFIFPSQDPAAPLLSLAESRSAGALESVRVTGSAEQSVLEQVAPVLCKFPSMKSLSVACVPPDVFFQAVSPASMPCLTALEVCVPAETCYHAWLHYPAVQDLLIRNPQLHLAVHGDWSSKDCACPWCRWGCHAELKGTDEFVFSAHTRMVCCPMNCLQVVSLFPLSDSEKTVSGPSLFP